MDGGSTNSSPLGHKYQRDTRTGCDGPGNTMPRRGSGLLQQRGLPIVVDLHPALGGPIPQEPLDSRGMTKQQLLEKVAAKTQLSKGQVEMTLDSVLEQIVEALQTNERVDLRGFGASQ